MLVLVCYDVATATAEGRRRLRTVAKCCENMGQRVQRSLFECDVNPAQWAALRESLLAAAALKEDSLRFYFLGASWDGKIEHHGVRPGFDSRGPLIV